MVALNFSELLQMRPNGVKIGGFIVLVDHIFSIPKLSRPSPLVYYAYVIRPDLCGTDKLLPRVCPGCLSP